MSEYGIDWSGPTSVGESEEHVIVPDTPNDLNTDQLSFIAALVNPLKQCDDYGKGFYVATRKVVREILDP